MTTNNNLKQFFGFNTASGRYYCNRLERSRNHFPFYDVSIPQAVGTIAIKLMIGRRCIERLRFNTASGRYYCNKQGYSYVHTVLSMVSIPQAVGTIAMTVKI